MSLPIWRFHEFNGANLIREPAADFCGQPSMLLLADRPSESNGQVNFTSSGMYHQAWAPKITMFPADVDAGGIYQIFGKQFNGLSQANAFGDEFGVATNFPLVRITNNKTGNVQYAHTYNFSSMGVATGSTRVSTWFDVPTKIETGDSTLVVVANGIPSMPVNITVSSAAAAASQN